ncbi:MAG: hypothetical protein KIT84_08855 [Labilithrix sp.]|nr:hypothetical protein [Labilithrix sp.]MCW5811108.1 hypothetical protein [Labilithrix sp.]
MSEFVFLYRGRRPVGTPEEMQAIMQRWIGWMQDLAGKGALKERGLPLERSGKVVRGKDKSVAAFADAGDAIGGYSVVTAKDIDHAIELSRGCPILEVGGDVEVRPAMQM